MCGIVGLAGDMNFRDEATIKRLLILDAIRGMDSTGFAAIRNSGESIISKHATHPFNLFQYKDFEQALQYGFSQAFIGHNRAATSGVINDVNAHPFKCEHITGVHNGTLEEGDKKMLEKLLNQEFNVDSEALFMAIARLGAKEVIPKLREGKDSQKGAWALVWWDAKENTLNFLRNKHRPMWYCWLEDSNKKIVQIAFASEFWMLDGALGAGFYNIHKKPKSDDPKKMLRFFQLPVDKHLKLKLSELKKGSDAPPKPAMSELKGKEPEAVTPTGFYPFEVNSEASNDRQEGRSGKRHGRGSANLGTGHQSLHKSLKTIRGRTLHSDTVAHIQTDVDEPYAGYLSRDEFKWLGNVNSYDRAIKCNWCKENISYGQVGITVISRDNLILCPGCSGNETVSVTSDFAPATRLYVPRDIFIKEAA